MAAIIVMLSVVCVFLFRDNTLKNDNLEAMCKSSVTAALDHFREYGENGNESDYMAGVAEFRTYMTSYLCMADGESDTDYVWCNILYGDMILDPENVKEHISELVDALGYLAEDYDHPNGFNRINELNNRLRAE